MYGIELYISDDLKESRENLRCAARKGSDNSFSFIYFQPRGTLTFERSEHALFDVLDPEFLGVFLVDAARHVDPVLARENVPSEEGKIK